MESIASPRFFVYVLARPNGAPFYVGKGTGDRINQHEREARRGHRCYKCNLIRKIWKSGGDYQRYIVFTTDNEIEALAYEVELIALYGRASLCNQTDGGEGQSGRATRPETREKLRAIAKARRATPETRAKLSEVRKGHPVTPETRAKMSAAAKAYHATPEGKVHQQRIAAMVRTISPEARQRMSDERRGKTIPPEVRAKITAAQTGSKRSPETRAKISASVKAARARRKNEE